jgi:hypothetical protein
MRGQDIPATLEHDAGAIARCSYCGRYTDDKSVLRINWTQCSCGKTHGWCGSFRPPTEESKWSAHNCEGAGMIVRIKTRGAIRSVSCSHRDCPTRPCWDPHDCPVQGAGGVRESESRWLCLTNALQGCPSTRNECEVTK